MRHGYGGHRLRAPATLGGVGRRRPRCRRRCRPSPAPATGAGEGTPGPGPGGNLDSAAPLVRTAAPGAPAAQERLAGFLTAGPRRAGASPGPRARHLTREIVG